MEVGFHQKDILRLDHVQAPLGNDQVVHNERILFAPQ